MWLNNGFVVALQLARSRRLINLASAVTVLAIVGVLTAISNIFIGFRTREEEVSLEACSSATIVLPADASVSAG